MKKTKELYKKYDSFVGFKLKEKYNQNDFISNLKLVVENKKNLKKLNKYDLEILNYVKKDLFFDGTNNRPKFEIKPNVAKEIQTLNSDQIPKYLVHRYRYEIHPQIRIYDDYPPYLQIEPTSICNYRCVFCYQTDNTFNKRSFGHMGHMTLDTFKKTAIDILVINDKVIYK